MKTPFATMALAAALAASAPAQAQTQGRANAPRAGQPGAGAAASRPVAPPRLQPTPDGDPAKADPTVLPAGMAPPEPIAVDQLVEPGIPLPNVPLDPYILRKENGPFMVMARTFRGPDATKYALALTLELRNTYHLPAYIWHLKVQPGGSNIRNVQPTAPGVVPNADITAPEKYRVFDEAAVLVGDCKTIDDAEALLHRLRKCKLNCLDALPTIWGQRKGSLRFGSFVTQNPLVGAQFLYPSPEVGGHGHGQGQDQGTPPGTALPGQTFDPYVATSGFQFAPKKDPLLKQMNQGPHSVSRCAGPYVLQVAEFTGRSSIDVNDPKFKNDKWFRKSPLATAADDAEALAANLAKCETLDPQIRPYVYHDRFSSKVVLGGFSGPDDPKLAKFLNEDVKFVIGELLKRKFTQIPLAPASNLIPVPRP
jgi:hypothetical protein